MTEENKDEVKNVVSISDIGPCKKKISVEIPEEKIRAKLEEDYKELRREAAIPGFRKGKSPMRLLEKRFGKDISEQVKVRLLADATDAAIKDNKIDMIGSEPNVDIESIKLPESGPMKFDFEVEVRPEFTLPALDGIKVEKPKAEVTDAQIDEELTELRKGAGLWKPVEGATVESGDQIIANVKVTVEGGESDASNEGTAIFVREKGVVAGVPVQELDKLLIGAKQGDVRTTVVEVPKTFYNEKYRDKKVTLDITIEDVKKLEIAEMNGEFFARFGVEDEKGLRNSIREHAENMLERQSRYAMAEDIRKYLLENTTFDLPGDVVADQSARLLQRQYINMVMRGTEREKVEAQMEELRTSSEEQAKEQLKYFFIMDKIADEFKIEVDDAEVNSHIAQVAIQRGRRPEKMREDMIKDGSLAQFTIQVREEKCIEKILEKAEISEVDAEKKPAKKAAAKKTTKKAEDKEDSAEKPAKKAAKKKED
jgi:trigger factor